MAIIRRIFLDFEASALEGGYPIEVGWSIVEIHPERDAFSLAVESHLICPTPEWRENLAWNPDAEAVHKITPAMLDTRGRAPETVAGRLAAIVGDAKWIYIDSEKDQEWLMLLAKATGREFQFRLADVMFSLFDQEPPAINVLTVERDAYWDFEKIANEIAPAHHRAATDTLRLAVLFLLAKGQGRADFQAYSDRVRLAVTRADPLCAYSRGLLTRRDAIDLLGLRDYASLLVALGDADLPMPMPPVAEIEQQAALFERLWRGEKDQ